MSNTAIEFVWGRLARTIRLLKKFKAVDLARKIEIDLVALESFERGHYKPTSDTAESCEELSRMVCSALDVNFEKFCELAAAEHKAIQVGSEDFLEFVLDTKAFEEKIKRLVFPEKS